MKHGDFTAEVDAVKQCQPQKWVSGPACVVEVGVC